MKALRFLTATALAGGLTLSGVCLAQNSPPPPSAPEQAHPKDDSQKSDAHKSDAQKSDEAKKGDAAKDQQKENQAQQDQAKQQQVRPRIELGVRLVPSRSRGVLVQDIRPGGSADQAGVRRGDYILSAGDKKVSSPEDLMAALGDKAAGETITMEVWRDGASQQLTVKLQEAAQPPNPTVRNNDRQPQDGRRHMTMRPNFEGQQDSAPWIGIWMEEQPAANVPNPDANNPPPPPGSNQPQQPGSNPAQGNNPLQQGIVVRHVFPSGPAARAGVRDRDVIVAIAEKKIASPQELIDQIASLKPNDTVKFSVLRGGQTMTVPIVIGQRGDYDDSQMPQQQNYQGGEQSAGQEGQDQDDFGSVPDHAMMLEQNRRFAEQHERLEKLILELKDDVRQLREELRQRDGKPAQKGETPGKS